MLWTAVLILGIYYHAPPISMSSTTIEYPSVAQRFDMYPGFAGGAVAAAIQRIW